MTSLPDLIQQLEQASGPRYEFDVAIKDYLESEGFKVSRDTIRPYSSSLDAKLPWEKIEQVALHDCVEGEPLGTVWEAWHYTESRDAIMGQAATEPLARRLAALKAKQKEDAG